MTTNRNATAAPRKDPKPGTWWFIVDLGKGPNGKRRQARRHGFTTKAQALEELTKVRRNVTTQAYVARPNNLLRVRRKVDQGSTDRWSTPPPPI